MPDVDGPTHAYIGSAPGCWQLYGEVLAREYTDADERVIHNLAVDAYAVQHPYNPDRRNRQSVGVHLISLCALLERGVSAHKATTLIGDIASAERRRGREWSHLVPEWLGDRTVADVHPASGLAEHRELVWLWTDSVWQGPPPTIGLALAES